ncbi:potassium channel family protein [Bacillus solimangrovi]|uniref:Potassium channel protein n=1 Tax=Bacillus solimangrovi TaxID=1305675 RepID=A0A1E5LAQ0_9BACI|nr:potassium channel protein [Bacillus solimangrovi]OEH91049.1 hypothetical protein BFG57_06665 [Bacillus solimangrovi]
MREYRQIVVAFLGVTVVVFIGTLGYMYFEDLNVFDSLWLTMVTVLTVGYGDVYPVTPEGKTFTLVLVPLGVGVATYGVGSFAALILEGRLSNTVGRKRMKKKMSQLHNHVIICGLGRVGREVLKQLELQGIPFVIVEKDEQLLEKHKQDRLYVKGDATVDQTLLEAGIERASGLIAALPGDADNVFISLTAKGLNKNIQVVSRVDRVESEEKLFRAGADHVVNTSSIGGIRMALSFLKPNSVEYLDVLFEANNQFFGVEEICVAEQSEVAGLSLRQCNIRNRFGVTVVAIKRSDDFLTHPSADDVLTAADMVIAFGTQSNLKQFERALTKKNELSKK